MASSPLCILALSGSLRSESSNTRLLLAASRLAPPGTEIDLYTGVDTLPHFSPGLEEPLPPAVAALRRSVARADALLISCPEYARGVPGAFKNALDWLVGGPELYGKPVATLNASPRATHAQAALRVILETVGTRLVHEACVTLPLLGRGLTADEIVADADLARPLARAVSALAAASQP